MNHHAANGRLSVQQIGLYAGFGKVQRRLHTADTSTYHQRCPYLLIIGHLLLDPLQHLFGINKMHFQ